MSERPTDPAKGMVRAIRDWPLKLQLYMRTKHIDPSYLYEWEWTASGEGANKKTPSMMEIEKWFVKNAMCEVCKGLKFVQLPLDNFTQHGTRKCKRCNGKGYIERGDE